MSNSEKDILPRYQEQEQITTSNLSNNNNEKSPETWKRNLSLVIQTLQTCLVVFLTSSSRRQVGSDGFFYLTSTAVVMSELFKFTTCFILVFRDIFLPSNSFFKNISEYVTFLRTELYSWNTVKCSIPAVLYSFQSNLNYIGITNLDMIVYQIVYQTKILVTAIFSVLMLKRTINRVQWFSLLLLMTGVTCVTLSTKKTVIKSNNEELERQEKSIGYIPGFSTETLIGLSAVMICSLISGFSGVYVEKILKETKTTIWVRNIQLSFFNLCCSFFICIFKDFEKIQENGFFQGYTSLTWSVVVGQGLAGLIVATVLKYADNVSKGFATSVAIVISTVLGVVFLNSQISLLLIFGSLSVCTAVVLYSSKGEINCHSMSILC